MCVLRVQGENFDPRAWVEHTAMDVLCVHAPGESAFDRAAATGRPRPPALHANVSRKLWTDWEGQVEDATVFLQEHLDELRRLGALPDVESLHIDFPIEARPDANVIHREARLPVGLIRAAADAGVEVILTVYVASEEGVDEEG